MMPLISLNVINKNCIESQGVKTILRDITLTIYRGEFIAITGRSGSGKSSLLNVIGLLDSFNSGYYYLDGFDISKFNEYQCAQLRNKYFGFIFQKYFLLNQLTVEENIKLPLLYSNNICPANNTSMIDLINWFGIDSFAETKINHLSGGQQQRICIARALINNNPIILADEPTGALDYNNGKQVINFLCELNKKGNTIILVTHDHEIAKLASRQIEIMDGTIIEDSNSNNIANRYISTTNKKILLNNRSLFNTIINAFKTSLISVFYYKLRSMLTILGIAVGIIAIILVFGIGRASQDKVSSEINTIGTNFIEIFPGSDFGDTDKTRLNSLTIQDFNNIKKLNYHDKISPFINIQQILTYQNKTINCNVQGITSDYFTIKNNILIQGRLITFSDINQNSSVINIDKYISLQLFDSIEASVGKTVFINKVPFNIIGVIEDISSTNIKTLPTVYIPYTTLFNKLSGVRSLDSIIIRVKNGYNTDLTEKLIGSYIRTKHKLREDFHIFNADSLKTVLYKTNLIFRILILSIALIVLTISGVGIMNIMMVTVTERRFEIGLRLALGATPKDILAQFVIESIIICLVGAVFGIIASFIIIALVNFLPIPTKIYFSSTAIILSIFASLLTGILFGFLPARKASKLLPYESLKCE